MTMSLQALMQLKFVPMKPFEQITAQHNLKRVMIASMDDPERVCGVARRVGFAGTQASDLALYRLKIMKDDGRTFITLPHWFVVDQGRFINYEEWNQARQRDLPPTVADLSDVPE